MPSYDPVLFNTNPYYDDFNEEKKFLRMLFRPGYAVQSRELTQLQTILQNQIERFGNHIFRDGARIIGGEISTQTMDYVRLEPSSTLVPAFNVQESDISGFNLIQRTGTGEVAVKARVVDFLPVETEEDPYVVAVVSYLSGTPFSAGVTLECDNPDKVVEVRTAPTSHTGKCKVVGANEGVYYINGFFVKSDGQFQPAYNTIKGVRDFSNPTGVMGFLVNTAVVTEKEDYTLKDPANGSYNYNAPGSHRYRINLNLSFVESSVDKDFIELVTYSSGEITKRVEDTQYSELIKLFAQRTFDESGNYIVKPFDASFRNADGNTLFADIGSGKAYVFGYEYETKFKETIPVPKARTTSIYTDYTVDNYYGNYVVARYNTGTGSQINPLFSSIRLSLGERTSALKVYGATFAATGPDLANAVFSARLVGTSNIDSLITSEGNTLSYRVHLSDVRYINPTGSPGVENLNLYAFNEQLNTSVKLFDKVEQLRDFNPGLSSRIPRFYDTDKQSLIFQLNGNTPATMIKNVHKMSYIMETFRGFAVDSTNTTPSVPLAMGVEFDWCLGNGFVPSGTDVNIDETDGYYLVYASGSLHLIGTIFKIVKSTTSVPAGTTKVTAKISGDGDFVTFTSSLPIGSYYLVGKAKNVSDQINSSTDPASKIRTKELTTTTEVITNTTNSINTFKRVVQRNNASSIYSMYFVLNHPDVYKIESIVDGAGNNVISHFLFDDGQRDAVYDLARLYVKPEHFSKYEPGKSFQISITYSRFNHSGFGPFLRESYVGVSYDNIPVYVSPTTENSIHLANAADYRFVAKIDGYVSSGVTTGTQISTTETSDFNKPVISYTNGIVPSPFTIVDTHEGYLPRIDKVVISKNISSDGNVTTLQRIHGNPSSSPIIPEDIADSMTLFVLSIPAYTFNASDVKADEIGNARFTMKDIGDISKRVDNLEQYAVLNDLELDVVSRNITQNGVENVLKKAILVDTFDGHSVADVADADHRCSIDHERGELKPSFSAVAYDFSYSGTDSGITLTPDNVLCSNYSKHSTPIISQEKATTTISVNPFGLPNWVGNIRITPHADYWFDRTTRPIVKKNQNGINDAWLTGNMNDSRGYGSQWNDWESLWSGISVELTDAESGKNAEFFSRSRSGSINPNIEYKHVPNQGSERFTDSIEVKKSKYTSDFRKKDFYVEVAPDTILNKSVVPKMRGNTITFSAYNLKPNTTVYVFFDNVDVTNSCTINGVGGPFTTNQTNGSLLNVSLNIPTNLFEIGDKVLRIIDDSQNRTESATTVAETTFYCTGIKQDDYLGISSLRPAEVRKQTPNSNKIVSNPLYKQKNINLNKFDQWIDPLAQTFEITESSYSNGVFLDSMDLFFATKDDDLPVTVELCPVVNGIPNTTVILPFSTVVVNPSLVAANSTTPTPTNFRFTTPVYLAPGIYAILVRTNTQKYSLFAGEIGGTDLVTEERVSSTFSGGVLFKAQNSAEASGDTNTDIMFKLNRCAFASSNPPIIINHIHGTIDTVANVVQPNVFAFVPSGVSIDTKLKIGSTTYDATSNRNFTLPQARNLHSTETMDLVMYPSVAQSGILTFMVDMDRTNVIVVRNLVNSSDSTTQEISPISGKNDNTARYISKKVIMPNGKSGTGLRVIMDANIPQNTFIRVYARLFNSSQTSTSVNDQNYRLMTEIVPNGFTVGGQRTYSLNANDFREVSYGVDVAASDAFDTFSAKICMYSSNGNDTPMIKNLRIVAI
jgi:hypothetical protein